MATIRSLFSISKSNNFQKLPVLYLYRGRMIAVSWPYRGRLQVLSWPYGGHIEAVWWPHSHDNIVAVKKPFLISQSPTWLINNFLKSTPSKTIKREAQENISSTYHQVSSQDQLFSSCCKSPYRRALLYSRDDPPVS